MSFGERMRELREDKRLTQKDIGKILCVSARQVSNYENGTHFPKEEMVLALVDYFDVSADYLFGITKVKNYKHNSKTINLYNSFPSEIRILADEYIEHLGNKYKDRL